jgi:two-component system, NtrC family, sensor kinase
MRRQLATRRTLRRRMIVQLGLMVGCSLLIGVGAVVGINGLHQDMSEAVQGYRELRQIYEVGFQVARARDALSADSPNRARAIDAMESAQLDLDPMFDSDSGEAPARWLDESRRDECRAMVQSTLARLQQPDGALVGQASGVNDVLAKLSMLSAEVRTTIVASQASAEHQRHLTLSVVGCLCVAVLVVAVAAGRRQYRSVVEPLDRIGEGARRFAGGKLSQRISLEGDREFAVLAGDFNQMADELEALYRDLEQKVETKSKELVRCERLASVGYLAAGVAHEINNPLSVISGYGERSLKLLDRGVDEETIARTRKTIGIICEEAFRCKGITERLLSLAKPGSEDCGEVSLPAISEDVVKNIGALPEYADRLITIKLDAEEDLTILARDGEMKQIVMNLVVNALEAAQPQGQVIVAIGRTEEEIWLSVSDDGLGMEPQTLDRVFEPFFTQKPSSRHGMGLGLSITHAIVTSHGGRIVAESAGLGRGSRFTVHFPAARKGVEYAHR